MKTRAQLAALAFVALSLAPQARAEEAKSFDLAAFAPRVERSGPSPGIVDATDGRTSRLGAPIVIEILSAAYLSDRTADLESSAIGHCESCVSPPTKPAKRR